MVPNYIEHTNVATSAVENDLLKNEIVKHLSLSQIKRANRIYVQLLHCYNTVFQYIGKLLDVPKENYQILKNELQDVRVHWSMLNKWKKNLNTRILFGKLHITDTRDLCLDVKEKTHIIA